MPHTPHVQVRRDYEQPTARDGQRVLVDRAWPRGLSKEHVHLDEWCKQIVRSTELGTWYGHEPEGSEEFAHRDRVELAEPDRATALTHLREVASAGPLTLLTATKRADIRTTVLAGLLDQRNGGSHDVEAVRQQRIRPPVEPPATHRRPSLDCSFY